MENRRDSSNPRRTMSCAGFLTIAGVSLLFETNLFWVKQELYRWAASPEALIDPFYPIYPVPISWILIGIGIIFFIKQATKAWLQKEQREVTYWGVVMISVMVIVTGLIVFFLPILYGLSLLYGLMGISSGVLFILAMSILALLFRQFYLRTKKMP